MATVCVALEGTLPRIRRSILRRRSQHELSLWYLFRLSDSGGSSRFTGAERIADVEICLGSGAFEFTQGQHRRQDDNQYQTCVAILV
ncbi:hypothetical protein BD410DRAFT_787754 [Rickenella mellea]|uniref:Uncharacterized protein n=1 Tax=Rickenella mellea TaxID=50990 RepID=A0A4Y7Q6U0_9AGAM|nr:hypothetical protein BD410DRAFT_787754 [Rickenella mellea]